MVKGGDFQVKKGISVVIAMNNEEQNVEPIYIKLKRVLEPITKNYELIFIEDGSNDNTYFELCKIYSADKTIKLIKLYKNSGQTTAFLIGFNFVKGEVIITMDGDGQHNPCDIPKFLQKITQGYDMVNGHKIAREDNIFIRTIPALAAKKVVSFLFGVNMKDINSTFRAYRKEILQDVILYGKAIRFSPLLFRDNTFSVCELEIKCAKREFGKSHFTLLRRIQQIGKDISILWDIKKGAASKGLLEYNHLIEKIRLNN